MPDVGRLCDVGDRGRTGDLADLGVGPRLLMACPIPPLLSDPRRLS